MKFKHVVGLLPQHRDRARKDVDYLENKLYDVFAGMMSRSTKEEIMQWCDEVYERAFNDYNDWLSTR